MTIPPEQVQALRPLLDLIYSGEGTYTSVNRGTAGDTPGGWKGLTAMTVREVMSAQAAGKVFAVGAPQFIPTTLEMVVKEAKVDRGAPFDEGMQDRLAAQLVLGKKRQKVGAFLRGQASGAAALAAAVDDLAYEWASLPLSNGRGAYDGDSAGNKAHKKVAEVEKALLAARKNLEALEKGKPLPVEKAPPNPEGEVLYRIVATQDTWLKKSTKPAAELPDHEKVLCKKGQTWDVVQRLELPRDAHALITLSHGAGTWHVFEPHWSRPGTTASKPIVLLPEVEVAPAEIIDWADFNFQITPYLTVGEVLQWDHRRRPAANSTDIRRILQTSRQHLQIRNAWGSALGVTSFYRPEPINRQVGGVPGSFHVTGQAMDVYPVARGLQAFYDWIRIRWTSGLGDGRHRGFIHLDTEGGGGFVPGAGVLPRRTWTY